MFFVFIEESKPDGLVADSSAGNLKLLFFHFPSFLSLFFLFSFPLMPATWILFYGFTSWH